MDFNIPRHKFLLCQQIQENLSLFVHRISYKHTGNTPGFKFIFVKHKVVSTSKAAKGFHQAVVWFPVKHQFCRVFYCLQKQVVICL